MLRSEVIRDCMNAVSGHIGIGTLGGSHLSEQLKGQMLAYNALGRLHDAAVADEEAAQGVTKLHAEMPSDVVVVRSIRYNEDENYTEVESLYVGPDGDEFHDLVRRSGGDYRDSGRQMAVFDRCSDLIFLRRCQWLAEDSGVIGG